MHNGGVPGLVDVNLDVRPWRTVKAAAEVWCLTIVAHSAAGGTLPSVAWLVGVAGLVAVSTAWVLRGSVRLSVMLPVLVVGQAGLHLSLAPLHPAATLVPVGHHHATRSVAGSAWWMHELSFRMVCTHVLCAVLTGVVWWCRRWVVKVVLSLTAGLAAPGLPSRVSGIAHSAPRPSLVWLVGAPGRAPPRLLAPA